MAALMGLLLLLWGLISAAIRPAAGNVVLIGNNISLSFRDLEASFAPAIKGSGECGFLYLAEPNDACTPLQNKVAEGYDSAFVLIVRGGCTFEEKVRSAQEAGFKAAIVYNNKDSGALVAMAGTSVGIHIHAVFVSKTSGETLSKYAGRTDTELWIIPTYDNSAWSIMAISFISLLAMSAVLATCFFVRRHRIRRELSRGPNVQEFHGMSRRLVKAMPSLIFTSVLDDNSTSATCAICLEDYNFGEKLRILPCRHKFHTMCVDSWLTTWRTFCPVCKQDARTSTSHPPPSECTPLLLSSPSTPNSSFRSSVAASSAIPIRSTPNSSFHSAIAMSSAVQIINSTPLPSLPLTSRTHSLSSSIPRAPDPSRIYGSLPGIAMSRSSADLRNASYHRPHASPSHLVGSSSRQSYLCHCSDSGASLSAFDSMHSLPYAAFDSMHSLPEC